MKNETETNALQEMAMEIRAYEELLKQIAELASQLNERGFIYSQMKLVFFQEWFQELGSRIQLFEGRGSRKGLSLFFR